MDLRAVSDAGRLLVLPLVRQQLHALLNLAGLRCARRFRLRHFFSLTCRVWADGSAGVKQRLFFSLFAVSLTACVGREKRAKNCHPCLKHQRNDQAEREAVGERAVEPASDRHR